MGHDPSKVVLGGTLSSAKLVTNAKGALIPAGLLVHRTSTDGVSIAKADGVAIGVSLGRNLSGLTDVTHIVREGLEVPIQTADGFAPTVGTAVYVDDVTGQAAASGTGKTLINATYKKVGLKGIPEDGGAEINVALIDMPGGV